MRKRIVLVLVIAVFVAASVSAAGGKNCLQYRGDIGEGAVNQHQVRVSK